MRMIVIVAETVIRTGHARAIATRVNMGVTTTVTMIETTIDIIMKGTEIITIVITRLIILTISMIT